MFRKWMMVGAASSCLLMACSKDDAASNDVTDASKTSLSAASKVAEAKQKAAVPSDLSAAGVSIEGALVKNVGKELEVTGILKNDSGKPVDGVNLMITFQSEDGLTLGGHNTQQFFQPALAAGKVQPLVLRAPALGGTINTATKAKIDVINLVKSGQSPDGWKPLDPENLPPPKIVNEDKSVTLPVEPVAKAQTEATVSPNGKKI